MPWTFKERGRGACGCCPGQCDGKGCPKQTKPLRLSPLLLLSDSPSLCNRLLLLDSALGGLARKSVLKAKKKSQIKVSTQNLCLGLKV